IITEEVKKGIEDAVRFAPLHNPAHLQGIKACEINLPGKPNVAVFDTAFHQTLKKNNIYIQFHMNTTKNME
ncbi:Acetate and butyrate kinase, partial [human gut metagenome]